MTVKKRGFGSMDKDRLLELSSKGGKNSSANFKYDREKAREAGRKGGQKSKRKPSKKSVDK